MYLPPSQAANPTPLLGAVITPTICSSTGGTMTGGGGSYSGGGGSTTGPTCPTPTTLSSTTGGYLVIQYSPSFPCSIPGGTGSLMSFYQLGVCTPTFGGGSSILTPSSPWSTATTTTTTATTTASSLTTSNPKIIFINTTYSSPFCTGPPLSSTNISVDTSMTCTLNPITTDINPLHAYVSVSYVMSLVIPPGSVTMLYYTSTGACNAQSIAG